MASALESPTSPRPSPPPGAEREYLRLHRHRAVLVGATDMGNLLAVAGDDPHSLIELLRDRLRCADFEKGDAVVAAGAEHLVARLLHLGRVGVARHVAITEREAQIAWPHLGKAEAGHGE